MTAQGQASRDQTKTLFLLFQLGADRYALAADSVGEVLPLVTIKALPGSPPAVAGLIDYRGSPVPVIDLNILALGQPARRRLSTRILLTRFEADADRPRWLGLIVEQATGTTRRPISDFAPSDVGNDAAPYLGPVAPDPDGMIQWIDPTRLLSAEIRDMLFREPRGEAA